uniref:ATP synthase epsilon chain, chloroplastic n=1 Tax=Monomorphina parapyrum TaxID=1664066 RepID=A0A0G3VI67_9EUGL|nr:ATPase epsilon subunit [Monomorphina parapyrum]AKL78928.1 ATPase epsilon subunit [Monomorphina parapyrum]
MSLEVSIIVPDRVFWKENANEIILPTLTGQMGVLKNHIPLLTGLDTGLILVRTEESAKWIGVVVMGGFALVNNNKVTILVNEAELGSEINAEEAEASFLASKSELESVSEGKRKIELTSQFKKARARFFRIKLLFIKNKSIY